MECLLALLPLAALLMALRNGMHKRRVGKQREFARRLETVLLPRETVKVICPQKTGNVVMTSKRILFETKTGFTAVNIKDIKRVQGLSEEGKKTTSAARMVSLTLKADREYTLINTGDAFLDLAGQLTAKVKKLKEKRRSGTGPEGKRRNG